MASKKGVVKLGALNQDQATKEFTDREVPQQIFRDEMAKAEVGKPRILTFYGIGGQGKSSLCHELIRQIKHDEDGLKDTHYAHLDLKNTDLHQPHLALFHMRNSLASNCSIRFPTFDLAFATYWSHSEQLSTMPEAVKTFGSSAGDVLSWAAEEGSGYFFSEIANIPIIGNALGRLGVKGCKKVSDWLTEQIREELRLLHPDGELITPDKILEYLPFFMARDIGRYCANKPERRLAFFIDEYERLWSDRPLELGRKRDVILDVEDALQILFANLQHYENFDNPDAGDGCPGILFTIFGREKLKWAEEDPDFADDLKDAQHLLGGLSPEDSQYFLEKVPVTEDNLRAAIIEGATYTSVEHETDAKDNVGMVSPLLLDLQVTHYWRQKHELGQELTEDEFKSGSTSLEAINKKFLERFLRDYKIHGLDKTLFRLSVARSFDEDLFKAIIREFMTGLQLDEFKAITGFTFVNQLEDGRYGFHGLVADALQSFMDNEQIKETQEFLYEYWDARAWPEDIKDLTPAHDHALLEAWHHWSTLTPNVRRNFLVNDLTLYKSLRFKLFQYFYEELKKLWQSSNDTVRVHILPPIVALQSCDQYFMQLPRKDILSAKSFDEAIFNFSNTYLESESVIAMSIAQNYADFLHYCWRYDDALEAKQRILEKRTLVLGAEHPDTLKSLSSLARTQRELKQYDQAMGTTKKALQIRQATLGPSHPDTISSLAELAFMSARQNLHQQSIELMRQVVESRSKILGAFHPDTIESMRYLSAIFRDTGNSARAMEVDLQLLESNKNELGPDHPTIISNMQYLARSYFNMKDYGNAFDLNRKVLERRVTLLKEDNADLVFSVANTLASYNSLNKAKEAVELMESLFTVGNRFTIMAMDNLAAFYHSHGCHAEALELEKKIVGLSEEYLGTDDPKTLSAQKNLSLTRAAMAQEDTSPDLLHSLRISRSKDMKTTMVRDPFVDDSLSGLF